MLFELLMVAAYVLISVYAYLKVAEADKRASYYEEQRDDTSERVNLVSHLCRMNLDYNAALSEDKEALCKEIEDLESQLEELEEQNVHLRGRLSAHWLTSN